MTKQERLIELQNLKMQHKTSIKIIQAKINDLLNMAPKHEPDSISYMMESNRYQTLLDIRMKPLQKELNEYFELLSNVEHEIEKIEEMTENEAEAYLRKYHFKKGTLKALDVLMDMTPEHVNGRVYSVNDNFLKYWLILVVVGAIITLIILSI